MSNNLLDFWKQAEREISRRIQLEYFPNIRIGNVFKRLIKYIIFKSDVISQVQWKHKSVCLNYSRQTVSSWHLEIGLYLFILFFLGVGVGGSLLLNITGQVAHLLSPTLLTVKLCAFFGLVVVISATN